MWESRSWRAPRVRYVLTDVRLVSIEEGQTREIALQDIREVLHRQSAFDRLAGTSTLIVLSRRLHHRPLTLRGVKRGAQLAALLELLASEASPAMDEAAVQAALRWTPRWERGRVGQVFAAALVAGVAGAAVVVGLRGEAASIAYPAGDAIYPGGVKRDREAIVRFMETEVLPWAKTTLGPLKGGPDRVTCQTCHGPRPEQQEWRTPAVAALPEPHVRPIGTPETADVVDAQMRNAIYGYLAESDNQAKAGYMRKVVVPGMARLLGRPAYDFTKTYEYNRTRFAIGCYHCHMVSEPGAAARPASSG